MTRSRRSGHRCEGNERNDGWTGAERGAAGRQEQARDAKRSRSRLQGQQIRCGIDNDV
ncbi:hypothetical protein LZ32DRAFT_610627 [Colletotrichum eremochloae]|nr:hypothetical protein LZ32DRAFT_610627 [Colletotrichum eremochloae]